MWRHPRSHPDAIRSARRTACSPGRTTTSPSRPGRPLGAGSTCCPPPRHATRAGVPIAPADYNLSDGFSPGQMIVVKVPGLDTPEAFAQTRPVPVTDLARAYDRRAPVVVINARTHKRHLIWAEIDSNGVTPETTALLIHPGVNWREGERYIVALRNLKDGGGKKIETGPRLQALPRPHPHELEGVRGAAPAHGVAVRLAGQGRDRPPRPLPGLGLHRRERELAVAPARVDPRPRLRRARRSQPPRPQGRGRLAQVHRRQDHRGHARAGARTSSAAWRGRSASRAS